MRLKDWSLEWDAAEYLDEGLARWKVPGGWVVAGVSEEDYRTSANPNEQQTSYIATALCFVPGVPETSKEE